MKTAQIKFKNGRKDIFTHTKAKMTNDEMIQRCVDVWGHLGEMEIEIF